MRSPISKQKLRDINKAVDRYFSSELSGDDSRYVKDGIVNLDLYNKAKYKILFLLKEVNDGTRDERNGGWSIIEQLAGARDGNRIKKGLGSTFTKVIYAVYAIEHNLPWNGMNDIPDDRSMIDVLQQIAVVNIKKQPGGSTAVPNELQAHYNRDKGIILDQIEAFAPDIIICGGTAHYIIKDLKLPEKPLYAGCNYWLKDEMLIIETHHPASRNIKTDIYVDEILDTVQRAFKLV